MPEFGTALVVRDADGTVRVDHADDVILVSDELMREVDSVHYRDGVLTLDTAGEYRYRMVRRHDLYAWVFERSY